MQRIGRVTVKIMLVSQLAAFGYQDAVDAGVFLLFDGVGHRI